LTHPEVSIADELLLEERLPWYVNGTLDSESRKWVEALLDAHPELRARLQRELTLKRTTLDVAAAPETDLGLDRLMARIRAENETPSATSFKPGGFAAARRWLSTLCRPPLAGALVACIGAQTCIIAWLLAASPSDDRGGGFRSLGVSELRTLRVSFRPDASESAIRAALVSSGARIVGGPTQLGEYWIASGSVSLEEMRVLLARAQVTASMTVDFAGPRGR
jgi:anti-sigma factor RsiW